MIKLFTLILIISFSANASETQIICEIKKDLFNSKLSKRFSKIIDFEKKTVENLSGHSFDNLMIFNNYEIIMNNKVFDFSSNFNILTKEWIIYDQNFIDIYKCKKRR